MHFAFGQERQQLVVEPLSEAEAASLLDDYLARAAGGSTVAQTVAQEVEAQC